MDFQNPLLISENFSDTMIDRSLRNNSRVVSIARFIGEETIVEKSCDWDHTPSFWACKTPFSVSQEFIASSRINPDALFLDSACRTRYISIAYSSKPYSKYPQDLEDTIFSKAKRTCGIMFFGRSFRWNHSTWSHFSGSALTGSPSHS